MANQELESEIKRKKKLKNKYVTVLELILAILGFILFGGFNDIIIGFLGGLLNGVFVGGVVGIFFARKFEKQENFKFSILIFPLILSFIILILITLLF